MCRSWNVLACDAWLWTHVISSEFSNVHEDSKRPVHRSNLPCPSLPHYLCAPVSLSCSVPSASSSSLDTKLVPTLDGPDLPFTSVSSHTSLDSGNALHSHAALKSLYRDNWAMMNCNNLLWSPVLVHNFSPSEVHAACSTLVLLLCWRC